jgi:RNA polymerase sigma-70 factor (ECF subfamily)
MAYSDRFSSTCWSLVLLAREGADAALETLCRTYWYPLHAYIRRKVVSTQEAEDLTQEFFTRLLEKDFLASVDRYKGRFRSFLLACCQHFLANERDRARAKKRGGGRPTLSLDFASAAERYRLEPADTLTPERLFDRRWALTLLDVVLDQLGREFHDANKSPLFDRLKPTLIGATDALSNAQIAADLAMTEAAVKKAAQRLRHRYRDLLREQIAATLDDPDEVDDEIRELFAALSA